MNNHFEDLPYEAAALSSYIFCIDTFVLSLKSGIVVRYTTENPGLFRQWLQNHNIPDINDKVGSMVYNYYFRKGRL